MAITLNTFILFFLCCIMPISVCAEEKLSSPHILGTSMEQKITFDSLASEAESSTCSDNKIKIKFGVYIVNISDINFPKNEYHIKFWGWAVHNQKDLNTETGFEVSNAKTSPRFTNFFRTQYENESIIWDQFFVSTDIYQKWETRYYPFDSQQLKISIEPIEYESDDLILLPDKEESRLAPDLELNGWEITNFDIKRGVAVYYTTSGDPKAQNGSKSKYSKIDVYITIKRFGISTFSFLFIGMLMGSFLIVLTLISNIYNTGKEFIGGALVVSIGSQYIINSNLPTGATFGFSHTIGIVTFSGLALAAILTTFHNKLIVIMDQGAGSESVISSDMSDSSSKGATFQNYSRKDMAKKWLKISILLNWILLIVFILSHLYVNGYLMLNT